MHVEIADIHTDQELMVVHYRRCRAVGYALVPYPPVLEETFDQEWFDRMIDNLDRRNFRHFIGTIAPSWLRKHFAPTESLEQLPDDFKAKLILNGYI